jgi:SPP1 gp7 family putative phage head morphogenesis protein
MRYDLAIMARRLGLKRRETTFAPILVTSAQANTLAAISHRILAGWYGSRAQIVEIYERELARRVQTDAIDELTSLFARLGDEVSRLLLDLTPALQGWAFAVEQWHRGKWARTVLAGTDVDISTMIGPSDAVESIETFMARNTALIRNVSDETRAKIADLVYRGLQQRTPSNQVGRVIAETLRLARRRANRIAADQSTKLAAALDRQRQREAGLDHWKWRHSGKLHYRPEHKARDGNVYTDKTAPEDEPGELPFCGCVRQGVLIIDGVAF